MPGGVAGFFFFLSWEVRPSGPHRYSARFQAFNLFICWSCINQFACAVAFVNFLLPPPALSALLGRIKSVISAVQ